MTTHATPGPSGTALVIGEALVDVVLTEGADPQEIPGGSPANVALGLARLGRDAALNCWIGKDPRGTAVRTHLEASGVHLTPGSDAAERTSTAKATIGSDGAATYLFDLDWNPPFPEPTSDEAPLIVHTGSIAAILAPGADTVRRTLETYRGTSTICYDPNARPQLMGEPAQARRTVEDLVALSDLVKCSNEDIEWLYGVDPGSDDDLEKVLRSWLELGAALVVVTRGKRGALALSASGVRIEVPADPNVVVADTVGAGDSFMGGLEDGLWSEGLVGAQQREELRAIDAAALERVVRHAAAIADITVSRAGANPPTRAELAGA
ncbi:carbohydrate kinase family protein [Actinomyces urogenitalis]|uniref:carbohydrate kinase family protein n=1 Tax=Actinomyces urogenitalis TaxID=103621 RepID=UPI00242C75B5|nr:carbohydrate kinase [Actinomyces urogenitalis]MCI7456480.1 carbohydrate kinase [Actinomyces urogenitalis]